MNKTLEEMQKELGKLYRMADNAPTEEEYKRLMAEWEKKRREYVQKRAKAEGLL